MKDTLDFRKKSENLLKAKPDSILMAPVFYRESVHFLGKCWENAIPFAFIDTPIDRFDYISFIGQNSCQSGAVAAKLLSYDNNPKGSYLVFNITREKDQLHHLGDREKGFREFFEDRAKAPQITTIDIHDGKPSSISTSLEKYKLNSNTLNGIFVTGSKVHLLAAELKKLGMANIRLVGYDLVKENTEYLKQDIIDFLISQQPEEQGYLGVSSIFNSLVNNKEVPRVQAMPIDIITRENLEQYPKCH